MKKRELQDEELYPTKQLRYDLFRFNRLVGAGEVDPEDHPEMEEVRIELKRRDFAMVRRVK